MQSNFPSSNNKLISMWQEEDVSNFIKNIGLSNYIINFQNNHISGYDLCYLSQEDIINELRITKVHDRNMLTKAIREAILEQLFLTLTYEEKSINLQLDYDRNMTLENLLPLFKDIFRINETRLYVLNSNQELLSPNCKIVDLILMNPNKYKNLIINIDVRKNYNESNKPSKIAEYNFKSNEPILNDLVIEQKLFNNKPHLYPEGTNYDPINNDFNQNKDSQLSGYKSITKVSRVYKSKEDNLKNCTSDNSFSSNVKQNSGNYLRNYEFSSKQLENTPNDEQLFKEHPQNNEIDNNQEIISNSKKGEIIERTNNYFNNLKNFENTSHISHKNNMNLYHESSQEGFTGGVNLQDNNPEEKTRYNYKFASSEKRFYRNLVDKESNSQMEDYKKDFNNTTVSKYSLLKNDDIYNKGNDLKSKIDSMRNEINNTLKGEFHKSKETVDDNNIESLNNKNRESKSTVIRNSSSYYSTKLYK